MLQLNRDTLIEAYRQMRTIRVFEDRLHLERPRGIIPGGVHLYAGQEAVAVGFCMNLGEGDYVASTHRGHGHSIAKGCDVKAMMKEIYGRQGGLCNAKGGSMHIADLSKGMLGANGIVGGGPPLVCGAALTAKTLKTGGVALGFIGDGASSQGTTHESFNLAAVLKLPAVFVLEDNGFGEGTPSSYAVAGNVLTRAEGFGLRTYEADGADFFAVYETAAEAVRTTRAGEGPAFVYVRCDRFYGHFEGDAQTYRGPGELDDIRQNRDPLSLFRARVTEAALLGDDQLGAVDREVATLIDEAVEEATNAPKPPLSDLTKDVYISY
jgi:TPP-dependent pyruvate/acetoin dehydrogenase alpha subunit